VWGKLYLFQTKKQQFNFYVYRFGNFSC